MHDPSNQDRFEQAISGMSDWATIDALIARLDFVEYWTPEFRETCVRQAKAAHARRMMKQLQDATGWPVFASVETKTPEGEVQRVYKQETLFDVNDYFQVVVYHRGRSNYHQKMASGYKRRAEERFHTQLNLPGME